VSENLIDFHIGQFSQKYADQSTWTNSDTTQKYYKLCWSSVYKGVSMKNMNSVEGVPQLCYFQLMAISFNKCTCIPHTRCTTLYLLNYMKTQTCY